MKVTGYSAWILSSGRLSRSTPNPFSNRLFSSGSSMDTSFWNDRYGDPGTFAYGKEPNDFLRQKIPELQKSLSTIQAVKCLFLAEGEGRNAVFVKEVMPTAHVVAMDSSSAGLDKCQQLALERGVTVETICQDLNEFKFVENHWDLIVGIFCHVPPPVRARMLQGVQTGLKSGGYFLLEAYTPDQLQYKTGGPPSKDPMYTSDLLQETLSDLEPLCNQEILRDVHEGQYHNGQAAVVQYVGRKK